MTHISFSANFRPQFIKRLKNIEFDLVVVGGGSTGTGIALDASSRGYLTGLIEMGDFASGTSSKSTKLIHGGLRYLKNLDFGLVRETGLERAVVHNMARHLVIPEKMLLPIVEGGSYNKLFTSIGLKIYDFLANVEKEDRRIMLDRDETIALEPLLDKPNLLGGSFYAEYRTDDARLTIELAKSAFRHGATLLNYVKCIGFKKTNGQITGVKVLDRFSGEEFEVQAKKVVIAAGHWSEDIDATKVSLGKKKLFLTKGVHIVVPYEKIPLRHTVYFDVGDGRMVFAIPRDGITYIGTTDTAYDGDKDEIQVTKEDVDYLIKAVTTALPEVTLKMDNIISSWAGLRTLMYEEGKSASEMSRHEEIFVGKDGLISVAGGKLTGYRKIAEKVVDMVVKELSGAHGLPDVKTRTDQIHLTSPYFSNKRSLKKYRKKLRQRLGEMEVPTYYSDYMIAMYGPICDEILDNPLIPQHVPDLTKVVLGQMYYAVNHEMIHSLLDFYSRRSGMLFFDPMTIRNTYQVVGDEMSKALSWNDERKNTEIRSVQEALEKIVTFT